MCDAGPVSVQKASEGVSVMQRFKLLFLASMAVVALSAMMAVSASAEVAALANGKPTAATFSGVSTKKTNLSVLGNSLEVLCAKTTSEGSLEASGKLGKYHIAFEGCDTTLGGTCTGLGDSSGTILSLGTIHLATNTGLTLGFILFLTEKLHFSCTVLGITKLFLVEGEYLCGVTPINALTSKLTIACKKGAERGDPAVTSYENDEGKAATITKGLATSEEEKEFVMSAEEGEGEVTVSPAVTLDV
jgi:hypothetical protein